jgi:hypothetical protein
MALKQAGSPDRALDNLKNLLPELEALYKDVHSHPELSMQETRTSALAADHLRATGFEVTAGVGKTGVVGLLSYARQFSASLQSRWSHQLRSEPKPQGLPGRGASRIPNGAHEREAVVGRMIRMPARIAPTGRNALAKAVELDWLAMKIIRIIISYIPAAWSPSTSMAVVTVRRHVSNGPFPDSCIAASIGGAKMRIWSAENCLARADLPDLAGRPLLVEQHRRTPDTW